MILIADSGSTKTDWRLLSGNKEVLAARTVGFNPYYQTSENIASTLTESLLPQLNGNRPTAIYFYGAGISSEPKKAIVETGLAAVFPEATLAVTHDLLGAALALCGTTEGIACILGTGSNTCHFNGKEIVESMPNLGFMLGDEGSGGYLGKRLIQAYLNKELPAELHAKFLEMYKVGHQEIMDEVYYKPFPNRYLASFTPFLSETYEHAFTKNLIRNGFADFFARTVCKYEKHRELPVHFLGSIAWHFRNELKEVAQTCGANVGKVIQTPIEGLIEYHRK